MNTDNEAVAQEVKEETNSSKRTLVLALAGFVLVVAVSIMSLVVYKSPLNSEPVRLITSVIPYPAVTVNGDWISFKEVIVNFDALKNFYAVQSADMELAELGDEEALENIVNNLIRQSIIEELAESYLIEVDQAQVDELVADAALDAGGEAGDLAAMLEENFAWTEAEFRARVIEPVVLAAQLEEAILADTELQADRRQIAASALARIESGEEFGAVASEVSEDASAMNGGDLGYMSPGLLPEDWDNAIFSLEAGEMTGVVEIETGYGIFKVYEYVGAGEDLQAGVLGILVTKRYIEDVVNEAIANAKINRLIED